VVTLDGQQDPIRAHARVKARKILISKLFPTVELSKTSIGQINGELDLAGTGNSVRRMLATSSGTLGLVVAGGEISRLMMEKAGLHLWEILELQVTGDELVRLRCAVADFDVREGVMDARALVFDTEITTLIGSGSIDLGEEKLDLTFNQQTKDTSPVALRSPIHLRGSFARPAAGVDKGRVATRALGAIALGMVNPLLSLIALVDADPGEDHDCAQLVRDAKAVSQSEKK
jgi:AsmA protein